MSDTEKQPTLHQNDNIGDKSAYVLDATRIHSDEQLKTSRDGHNVLIPQPSKDQNDPLNWSQTKKNVILFVISATAFLPDYGSATGAVTLIPQAEYVWRLPTNNRGC